MSGASGSQQPPEQVRAKQPLQLHIKDKFKDLSYTPPRVNSSIDWDDNRLCKQDGLHLRSFDQTSLAQRIKEVFKHLETGVSQQDVGKIIEIAWNIVGPEATFTRIYPSVGKCSLPTAETVDSLDDDTMTDTNVTSNIKWPSSELDICKAGTFFCASILRMFTKDKENFKKAWKAIIRAYPNFHKISFPILNFEIRNQVIDDLHLLLQSVKVCRATFANLLYHFPDIKDHKGMLTLLFEEHVRYTGMHCVPLFFKVREFLTPDTPKLLSCCRIKRTKNAIACLEIILTKFEGEESELKKTDRDKKTYMYSRLYDETAFADIQTKNAADLALVLAYLANLDPEKGQGNVLDIAVLARMPQGTKDIYKKFALAIYSEFKKLKEISSLGK